MSTRDRRCYAVGAALYVIAAYYGLQLLGAPMDAVNELLKVLAISLLFVAGICWLLFASVNRWTR